MLVTVTVNFNIGSVRASALLITTYKIFYNHAFYTFQFIIYPSHHFSPAHTNTRTHTPNSGLYQNPISSVCELCDLQCVGGCTNGTVRL